MGRMHLIHVTAVGNQKLLENKLDAMALKEENSEANRIDASLERRAMFGQEAGSFTESDRLVAPTFGPLGLDEVWMAVGRKNLVCDAHTRSLERQIAPMSLISLYPRRPEQSR
jgi:hypothetical protein